MKLILSEQEKERLSKYNFVYIPIKELKYKNNQVQYQKGCLLICPQVNNEKRDKKEKKNTTLLDSFCKHLR